MTPHDTATMVMWQKIKTRFVALASWIGRVQSGIILTVCYIVVVAPVALILKLCTDALRLKPARSLWRARRERKPEDRMAWARSQS